VNKNKQEFGFIDMSKLVVPQLVFLIVWTICMMFLFNFKHDSGGQEQIKNLNDKIQQQKPNQSPNDLNLEIQQLKSQVRELREIMNSQEEKLNTNQEILKPQLDEMRSANSKLFDLVIGTLGTVVTIAVAVPALSVISQIIANRETVKKIQTEIEENLAKKINELSNTIYSNYLNDLWSNYEIFNLSINQAIEKTRDVLNKKNGKIGVINSLNWIENLAENNGINNLDKDDFKKLEIYRYPILLEDCLQALIILKILRSSKFSNIPENPLYYIIKKHLKVVQLTLIVMNQSKYISEKLHVAPKPTHSQIQKLEEIIDAFKNDYAKEAETIKKLLIETNNETKIVFRS
jgi:hypothetical protein